MKPQSFRSSHLGLSSVAVLALALFAATAVAQEQNGPGVDAEKYDTHEGEVVRVTGNRLVMTIDGEEQQDRELVDNIRVKINEQEAKPADLRPGDRIRVVTPKGNQRLILAIGAARADDSRRDDSGNNQTALVEQKAMLGVAVWPTDQGQPGVLVAEVMQDGPAAKAGVQEGDHLLQVNDRVVNDPSQLQQMMLAMAIDTPVELVISRDGQKMTKKATLAAIDRTYQQLHQTGFRGATEDDEAQAKGAWFGISMQNEADADERGVRVLRTFPGSPAARAGLRGGDLITTANGQVVTSPQQFGDWLAQQKPGDEITLKVMRGERPWEMTAKLAQRSDYLSNQDLQWNSETDDPLFTIPEYVMRSEHERRCAEQRERIEGLVLQVLREVRDLRQEVEEIKKGQTATDQR